ncbi:hypothetical protein GCM10007304_00640 [Rhodococcoides trifolii]|uniref:Uncharacterized protein n=2 Tax=Rhodococcoides trifolii TaxID=908250 RepID=A0A917FLX0_9NOCA|nr:hypothetical protein GCM10007304_00640 [Rhodococcus trifolii]
MIGPAVTPMSLEVDPSTLALADVDRLTVDVPADLLDDVLALRLRPSLTVFSPGADVASIALAGHTPGLTSASADEQADFLAVVAHLDGGFVARCATATEVLSVISGTVAALRGDDIRTGLLNPNIDVLTSLHPDAAAATRTVLLGIETEHAGEIATALDAVIAGARGRTT